MPNKVKPTWICQACSRPFTTKYSLMRHFKRFPEHSPPNLVIDGGDDLKPVTVTLEDGVRTVKAGPSMLAVATRGPPQVNSNARAATPLEHNHGTRRQAQQTQDVCMVISTSSEDMEQPNQTIPVVVEQTPTTPSCDFATPATSSSFSGPNSVQKGQFPFLPPFLEEEQILNIATPQQKQPSTPAVPPPSVSQLQSPLVFSETLLSPLAPTYSYGQVFEQEVKQPQESSKPRSPPELSALDQRFLLGDDEATSPFTFLEKTSGMTTDPILPTTATSLDFFSPQYSAKHGSSNDMDHDLDFGFSFPTTTA